MTSLSLAVHLLYFHHRDGRIRAFILRCVLIFSILSLQSLWLFRNIKVPDSSALNSSLLCSHITCLYIHQYIEWFVLDDHERLLWEKIKYSIKAVWTHLLCSQSVMTAWQPSIPSLSSYLYFHNLTNRAALWSCRPLWSVTNAIVAVSGEGGYEYWCALWSHAQPFMLRQKNQRPVSSVCVCLPSSG